MPNQSVELAPNAFGVADLVVSLGTMLALFLANTQGVGPTGLIVLGGFCFLIGVWFSIAIVSDRLRAIFRAG